MVRNTLQNLDYWKAKTKERMNDAPEIIKGFYKSRFAV